ncbi:hypothetical protein [Marinobacterium stanieri]|uniref:hypothetical protein n=1 Tax=Marinobacterium stanieri TaxID=49186 RepID=UPI003A8CD8DD
MLSRLTLFGALYITAVSLMPQFLVVAWNAILLRRYIVADRGGSGYGLYGAGVASDVTPA